MSKLSEALARARTGVTYLTETIVLDFIYEIDRIMETRKMSRADLAKKVGVSPAYISKILRGEGNLTLKSVVSLADAVGAKAVLKVIDKESPLSQMDWTPINGSVFFPKVVENVLENFVAANESEEWKKAA